MKKLIILASALLISGVSKAQFADDSGKDGFFSSETSSSTLGVPVTSLNKVEFKKHLDSFRKEGIQFKYRSLDSAGNLIQEVLVNANLIPSRHLITGNAEFVYRDEEKGETQSILIEGDNRILRK